MPFYDRFGDALERSETMKSRDDQSPEERNLDRFLDLPIKRAPIDLSTAQVPPLCPQWDRIDRIIAQLQRLRQMDAPSDEDGIRIFGLRLVSAERDINAAVKLAEEEQGLRAADAATEQQ